MPPTEKPLFPNPLNIERELRLEGLSPKNWPEVLETIKSKLSPLDWSTFSRLHKNFTGYPSESTLARFYGFVFSHGLQKEINSYRFNRLTNVLSDLCLEIQMGQSILDIGAGSGIVGAILQRNYSPKKYVVHDFCAEVRDELQAQGFSLLANSAPEFGSPERDQAEKFELILCIDSLGEINGDDDDFLSKPNKSESVDFPDLLEERYGFAQKTSLYKSHLQPEGRLLLWEPFPYQKVWVGLDVLLQQSGWQTRLISRAPNRNYLELRLK